MAKMVRIRKEEAKILYKAGIPVYFRTAAFPKGYFELIKYSAGILDGNICPEYFGKIRQPTFYIEKAEEE